MSATGAKWSSLEDAVLREHYVARGSAWCARELGRTAAGVTKRAVRLRVVRVRPWTHKEDDRLRMSWGPLTIRAIAKDLGRTETSIYWRAKLIGLSAGCPQGYEYLSGAAARTGYATSQLRRICRWAGVHITRAMVRPTRRRAEHHVSHIVIPFEIDEAVAAWLATETLHAGARRHGYEGSVLKKMLLAALERGDERAPPPPTRRRGHWRVPTALIDELFADRDRHEPLDAAAERHAVDPRTLYGWLRAAGVASGRGIRLEAARVDAVVAEHRSHESIAEAAQRHGLTHAVVRSLVAAAVRRGDLERQIPGRRWRLLRATYDALIAADVITRGVDMATTRMLHAATDARAA